MVQDSLGRKIEYARVSLTEACNFACPYCRPYGEGEANPPVLSVEAWLKIFRAFQILGIRAIRLTGGEPLLYPNIEELIRRTKEAGYFEDMSLTTNASLLAKMASPLQKAGLNRVNISLDGLTEEQFANRTGGRGTLKQVLEGIEAAVEAGLTPVKINTVLLEPFTDEETKTFIEVVNKWPVIWRFIEYMPFQDEKYRGPSFEEWKAQLEKVAGAPLEPTTISRGFGPAQYYKFPNGNKVGFIFPMTNPYCENCNRIRITAQGSIRLCLLRPEEYALVGDDFDDLTAEDLAERIRGFLQKRHAHHDGRESHPEKDMYKIGG